MKGHGGRPFGYVGFLRVLRLSPIRMDDRGAAVPFTYLKVAIYGAIFFWLICLISEHTLYKYLIPKMLGKLPAEFNAIIFSHKICVEIRLFSSKLSQFLCSVNYNYLTRTETSSQIVHPHFFQTRNYTSAVTTERDRMTNMHACIYRYSYSTFFPAAVRESGVRQLPTSGWVYLGRVGVNGERRTGTRAGYRQLGKGT